MKIVSVYTLFVALFFSLTLAAFAVEAEDTFDDEGRLFIPELRAGTRCFEDMAIQFHPSEDMWSGGYELMYFDEVKCEPDAERLQFKEDCDGFGPQPGCG